MGGGGSVHRLSFISRLLGWASRQVGTSAQATPSKYFWSFLWMKVFLILRLKKTCSKMAYD